MDAVLQLERTIEKVRSSLRIETQVVQLKDLLSNTWGQQARDAIIRALKLVDDLGEAVNDEALRLIMAGVATALGQDVAATVKKPLIEMQEAIYLAGMREVSRPTGISIGWGVADKKALDSLHRNTLFWIGDRYGAGIQSRIDQFLQRYFEGGYTRDDLKWFLKVEFAGEIKRAMAYWDLLADHTATKIREIGRLSGYEQAGIRVVRIKARLDNKTSAVCRRLHGHVISVQDLRTQASRYLDACEGEDKEKIKKVWPWWSDKQAEDRLDSVMAVNKQIKAGKVGLPPYHARCRTITVAEFTEAAGAHIVSDDEIELGAMPADVSRRRG